ncbi:MAG: hypothetical protein CVT99_15485 [Bacteroidetes bacterium HGW-Bacteroidetes-16]|jgi:integrase|nr:MAG: hypothetical protein CVT99_15485 [Bacteroidetes bacterium HGW-Bacteroidetes-16]
MNDKKPQPKKRTAYKVPKFYLDAKDNDQPSPIFLKYSFAPGQRLSYYTGERIESTKWSIETQRVKRNVTGATEINDILKALSDACEKEVRENRLSQTTLTKEALKAVLDNVINKESNEKTIFDLMTEFIESETKLKSWTKGTITKLNTIKTQLQAFESSNRKTQPTYKISLKQINEQFFEDLVEYWQIEYDLRNSTIQKNIEILRWFFNWTVKKGYGSDKFKKVEIDLKQSKHKVIYLELDEIRQINEADIPDEKQYLTRTKDIFVFQCLTGLRFSDLYNLKASNVHEDYISVNTIKTGEPIEIELNDTTKDIIKKYKQHQDATGNALPVPQNQVYNRFLKELAEIAKINESITLVYYQGATRIEKTYKKWQLISSHTARRSFITNGLALGIGSEVIRSWTGHQSERSFKGYYEIVKKRKRTDMNKMNL